MNRTEAVVRMLRGEILRDDIMYLRIKDGKLQMNAVSNDPDSGWINWRSGCDYLSEPSLRVVEPKSKIEEAIERELESWYGCSIKSITDGAGTIPPMIRRVVNLALDEAKKAAWGNNISMCDGDMEKCVLSPKYVGERIDSLKVKE